MQLRPSLSARVSEAMPRLASKGRALYTKDGCSRLMKMCWPVVVPALHQGFETETFPMPARRDIDWLEFHLVADRGPHESAA